jgi:hypothetical protein
MNYNEGKINPREIKIQGLLDGYLRLNSSSKDLDKANHLDEDTLTAFIEGNLMEREAKPITNHLVGCSFCRHITSELIKLDLEFVEDTQIISAKESEPTKVSEVLSGILSRIFGTNDGAVFAHQESDDEESNEEIDKTEEK